MRWRFVGMLALLWLAAPAAQGAQFRVLQVRYSDGLHVEVHAFLRVPVERVEQLLDHYDALAALVPIVTESQLVAGAAPGAQRVRTKIHGCFWFFCATLNNVIDVTRVGDGEYRAVTVPALSDFSAGRLKWSYAAAPHGTLLTFSAWLKPNVWLPPLIGPYLLERKVRSQLIQGVRHLEWRARRLTGADSKATAER